MHSQCGICDKDAIESKGPLMPWETESKATVVICSGCYFQITGKDIDEQLEEIQSMHEMRNEA